MADRYYCRFTNVTIVNGADIRECFVRFFSYDGQVTDNIQLKCYLVDEDNPAAPADKAELDALNLTAGVDWNDLPTWQDGSVYMTPDLATLLETVVGRAGWSSGNAVILVIEDNSSAAEVHRKISAYEYNRYAEKPELHVGWYSSVEGFPDNTKWQPAQLNPATAIETEWDAVSSRWNFNINNDSDGGKLVVKGTWHVNYQPREMVIKHTHGGTPELKVYAADGIIHHSLGYTSEDIITPLWAGRSGGIYAFQFELAAGDNTLFNVTDITFNSALPDVQTTTSTSSTISTTSTSSSTASTTSSSSTTSSTASSITTTSTMSTTSSTSSTMSTSTSTSTTASSTSTATTGSTYSTFSTTHTTISTTTSTSSSTSSTMSTVSTISTTSTSTSTSTTASTSSTASSTSTISTTSTTGTPATTHSTTSSTASTVSTTSTSTSTSSTASTISTTTSTSSTTSSSSSTTTTTVTAPPTTAFYPAASGDDGECDHAGGDFGNSGFFDSRFGDIGGTSYRSFVRFTNVTIPNAATITSAFLRIEAGATNSTNTCDVNIKAQDENDPSALADGNAVINATLGTEVVNWSDVGSWTDDTRYDSPDITDVIQEIIDKAYWASGEALIIHILDNSSDTNAYRTPTTWDLYNILAGDERMELHVSWT